MVERENRSLNFPAGHEKSVNVTLNTSPSSGACEAGIPTFPARSTRNISLEFASENNVTTAST